MKQARAHVVTIRRRPDGITELAPRAAPLPATDRWIIIVTVLIVSAGFFLIGAMPAAVAAIIAAFCIAGELVLGAKALLLALLRPPAQVLGVRRRRPRRAAL